MQDNSTSIQELKDLIADFVGKRDWNQFHTPKNLSMSISIEAAELMELFQWMDQRDMGDVSVEKVQEELADVVIYCLSMANATGIDLASAVRDKVEVNAGKYPVEQYKGRYK